MKIRIGKPEDAKLSELILLILSRSECDEMLGAVKLNKLLFHCDFLAYQRHGKSITGQEYFRLPKGPAPRRLKPVTDTMIARNQLAIKVTDYYGYNQHKPVGLREPDLSAFTPQEVSLVDRVIQRFVGKNATEISDHSHLFIGWKLAQDKETIPYPTALVGFRKPTAEEMKHGLKLEKLALECLSRVS